MCLKWLIGSEPKRVLHAVTKVGSRYLQLFQSVRRGEPGSLTMMQRYTRSVTFQDSLKFYKVPLGYESVKSEDSLKLYGPIVS